MEGPSRSTGTRQSRRSRSQRDRERRRRRVNLAEERATSLSSGSDREDRGTNSVLGPGPGEKEGRPGFGRHRPPRRRKRESVSCEEDIIDGFAIASFVSLEALEMDCSMKPSQHNDMLGRRNKGKRGPEENGGGPLSEPEEGVPHSYPSSCRNKRRKLEVRQIFRALVSHQLSSRWKKEASFLTLIVFFFFSLEVVEPPPSTVGKSCPGMSARSGIPRLMVTPRVSGLERSQEKSLESHFPEAVSSCTSSASFSRLPSRSPASAAGPVPRPGAVNGNGGRHHNGSPPLSKPKPFLTLPGRSHTLYSRFVLLLMYPKSQVLTFKSQANDSLVLVPRSNTPVKPASVASSSSSMRPPTPSTSVSMSYIRGAGSSGPLRPPSRANSGALFTSSPGLPPPPPLLQGPSHSSAAGTINIDAPGAEGSNAAVGRSTPGGASASSSTPGSTGRTSQNQPSVQPLAYQFHQHNHQHQHTHTHQHFTPFLHPTATAPPLFDKYPGKMEGLYRHPFFPQYPPPPSVPNIQPVIPPTGPFSSLQGAFQPKGTGPDLSARLGVVPHHLQPKDHRVRSKPGKWCAMHVYVAWMILSHQKKVKLMQADPHKLDFRNDLLARLPGAGGLGPMGPIGGPLPPNHDLTRPPSLFSATDPYGRSPPFTPLGALGSGAFGGLGSPTLAGSMFGPKDSPASVVGSLSNASNHHEPWNRLHGTPSGFPAGPSWAKGGDKRDERDRAKDGERRDIPHIKDEKDRDNTLYGRPPVRMSPVAPSFKPRSSTPISHINGHSSSLGGGGGPIEDMTRSLNRDRERERDRDGDKRPLPTVSSRGLPHGASTLVAERDRPRSSSSSVLNTPPLASRSAQSPLDLYPRSLGPAAHVHHNEHSQRDGSLPASSAASASVTSLSQAKKSDRTTTPVSKPPLILGPIKVKEERKEEPEHIPISLPAPLPNNTFDRPNSHPHHHSSGTPSSSLSLTPTPGVPLPPPTPNPPSHLSLLDRSRAIEAYLGSAAGSGLVMGPSGERFTHGAPQGPSQGPHSFTWDPWRELAAQQHQQHRREAMALRSDPHLTLRADPHLARLLQHQRLLEAERAAAVAAAATAPHHPSTSTASTQLGPPGGGLMDEEQRAQILREDFERARFFGMHPHLPPSSHLSSPSHAATAAHLEQLHPGLLSHHLPPGAAAHHASLYARLGPLNTHHVPNGILAKTPAGLVGALSMGAPPPLIPSITSRASTPPRGSRLMGPGELTLFGAHKDGESR
uniref:Fibrosin n=1 Tax=Hippocampus comes TaxID=109280 RepID=A0A3Q2YKP8_HIPCM